MAKQSSSTAPGADTSSSDPSTTADAPEADTSAAADTASTAAPDPAAVVAAATPEAAPAPAPVPAAPLVYVRKIEERANEAVAAGDNELYAALSALAVDLGAVRSRLLSFDCDVGGDLGGFLCALKENL